MDFTLIISMSALGYMLYFLGHAAGSITAYWDLEALVVVGCGVGAAALINTPPWLLKDIIRTYLTFFLEPPFSPAKTISLIKQLAEKAKKEGLYSLKDEGKKWPDQFLSKIISMMILNIEPHMIKEVSEKEIFQTKSRHATIAKAILNAGLFAPVFGLFGTLAGVIRVLQQLSDPTSVGPAMAMAVMASLYGILVGYIILNPVSGKLKYRNERELQSKEMLLEGMLMIQAGELPSTIERNLSAYTYSKTKTKKQ